MAVLVTGTGGWILSHKLFVEKVYEKTNAFNVFKSYHLNPLLFDIQTPFVESKIKCSSNNDNKSNAIISSSVKIVKKAYEELSKKFECLVQSDTALSRSNETAKSIANKFYCHSALLPDSSFTGGNTSQESLLTKIKEEFYLIPKDCFFYCCDVKDISQHLEGKEFDIILMDPPWWNKFIRRKRKQNSKFAYSMVYNKDLSSLPINSLLLKNGIIGVWCTNSPSQVNAVLSELFPAWNVEFLTQWFWLKVTKYGKPVCDFSETCKKQPFERIIFGFKKNCCGPSPKLEKEKVILSIPSSVHSHKPPLSELLNLYLPDNPKCLELFARYLLPSWSSYGNEVLKLQHLSLYEEGHLKG